MKKLLNTLYISTQKTYLARERQTVVVRNSGNKLAQIPIHTLDGIVCFGNVLVSPFLLELCSRNAVTVSMLSEYGKFLSRFQGAVSGNVLLRRNQYRFADNEQIAVDIIKNILCGKILNSRTVIRRAMRDHPGRINRDKFEEVSAKLKMSIARLEQADNADFMRGIEGETARYYFSVFNDLILADDDYFTFSGRNRRPPRDPVNALLSFLYTIMMHDVCSALEGCGLDPAVGFLHRDRPGRMGLALDLMEEFRAVIVDRLVLSLINRKQIVRKDFQESTAGVFKLKDKARKDVLAAYQNRKSEEVLHPYIDEKVKIGLLFHIQAMLMARYIRGDIDGYPVFFWK
ncbi:MAG: type I-C CRISPR-associated endonuclease Cas1 [Spirochaetales bacterium]|nr:type I-C CRISPR-associated endonuclease Cas1 [Spirochaetales bacterium]